MPAVESTTRLGLGGSAVGTRHKQHYTNHIYTIEGKTIANALLEDLRAKSTHTGIDMQLNATVSRTCKGADHHITARNLGTGNYSHLH